MSDYAPTLESERGLIYRFLIIILTDLYLILCFIS